ncbi:MAG: 30S ribosomal protein S6 [Alphaproteobacteria bacterium]|nr:30S ribosomal protein S6 [Alphaproteobacteria bacterium]
MPIYETVCILRPDLSKAQVDQINSDNIDIIKSVDKAVKIGRQEYWGARTLAYRIKKQRKGHYLLVNYEGESAAVKELERKMGLNEDVLRYITVRLDAMPTEPSPMMKIVEDDDYRRPRYNKYDDRPNPNRNDDARNDSNDKQNTPAPTAPVEADAADTQTVKDKNDE